jgi:hypothetical protein
MSKQTNVYEEPETLRLLGLEKPREKRDPDEEFLRELDKRDMERAADRIEELSAGWVDWRGSRLPASNRPAF